MNRRRLAALFSSVLVLAALDAACLAPATAKDGDGGGGGGDGGGRGGDSDGGRGGGDNSGRGSDNSGRGGDDGGRGRGGDDSGRGDDGGRGRGRGGDDDGGDRGRGRGGDDGRRGGGWGSTSSENARDAVSRGWALALSTVLPTVSRAVPGQVLEVDLRQSWTGEWRYEFLVLTRDRRYREVVVDARRNQVIEIRRR